MKQPLPTVLPLENEPPHTAKRCNIAHYSECQYNFLEHAVINVQHKNPKTPRKAVKHVTRPHPPRVFSAPREQGLCPRLLPLLVDNKPMTPRRYAVPPKPTVDWDHTQSAVRQKVVEIASRFGV